MCVLISSETVKWFIHWFSSKVSGMLIRSRSLLYSSRINPGIHKQIQGVSFPSFDLPVLSSIFSGSLDLSKNLILWFSDYSALSHVLIISLKSRIKLREIHRKREGDKKVLSPSSCNHIHFH